MQVLCLQSKKVTKNMKKAEKYFFLKQIRFDTISDSYD